MKTNEPTQNISTSRDDEDELSLEELEAVTGGRQETTKKLENLESQDLASTFNQNQTPSSSVWKELGNESYAVIGKI